MHASEPALLGPPSALQQRFERSRDKVPLHELQVSDGPDRIIESLDGLAAVQHVPRISSVKADLSGLLAVVFGKADRFTQIREVLNAPPEASASKTASRHIERLWARDEVLRLMTSREYAAVAELAAQQQVVTPSSGAVVLQTQQQFEQHGLTPADPTTVPSIPEPETQLLFITGAAVLMILARRVRRSGRTAASI